jgi:hypothetical protein
MDYLCNELFLLSFPSSLSVHLYRRNHCRIRNAADANIRNSPADRTLTGRARTAILRYDARLA